MFVIVSSLDGEKRNARRQHEHTPPETLRNTRSGPHERAVRPRRRLTRPGTQSWTSPAPETVLGKAPRKHVESPAEKDGRALESHRRKGDAKKRGDSQGAQRSPRGCVNTSGIGRSRHEATSESPPIVTMRVTNERETIAFETGPSGAFTKGTDGAPPACSDARTLHSRPPGRYTTCSAGRNGLSRKGLKRPGRACRVDPKRTDRRQKGQGKHPCPGMTHRWCRSRRGSRRTTTAPSRFAMLDMAHRTNPVTHRIAEPGLWTASLRTMPERFREGAT